MIITIDLPNDLTEEESERILKSLETDIRKLCTDQHNCQVLITYELFEIVK